MTWYKRPKDGGERTQLQQDDLVGSATSTYTVTTDDIDSVIEADTQCPDPSSPDGYGTPLTQTTGPVEANYNFYNYVRWVGTKTTPSGATAYTSSWLNISAGNMAATISGVWGCVGNVPLASDISTTCPAVGPVNWRSAVYTTNKTTNPTGLFGIGDLSVYDKLAAFNSSPCSSPTTGFGWGGTVQGRTLSVAGKWEFSIDGSTVAAEWDGRTDQSEGE